jgi:hypothetical protein
MLGQAMIVIEGLCKQFNSPLVRGVFTPVSAH